MLFYMNLFGKVSGGMLLREVIFLFPYLSGVCRRVSPLSLRARPHQVIYGAHNKGAHNLEASLRLCYRTDLLFFL